MNRRNFLAAIAGAVTSALLGRKASGRIYHPECNWPFGDGPPCGIYDHASTDALLDDLIKFWKKWRASLAIPGGLKVASSRARIVELIRTTRPEVKPRMVISDADIRLWHCIETLEASIIQRRLSGEPFPEHRIARIYR